MERAVDNLSKPLSEPDILVHPYRQAHRLRRGAILISIHPNELVNGIGISITTQIGNECSGLKASKEQL
jgi:hypothetical protein